MNTLKRNPAYKPRKWYTNDIFPLLPVLTRRKACRFNTASFTFEWLFFKCWSLDSFGFELALVADTHWGIGVIGILPYLRWKFTIPCPHWKVDSFLQKYLWRKPNSNRDCDY